MADVDTGAKAEKGKLTGRHVLIGILAGFAVILTANMAMVIAATGSFPGLVVKNSYVASQGFNARSAELSELGWRATIGYSGEALTATIQTRGGSPAAAQNVVAVIGRPSDARSDRTIELSRDPSTGAFVSAVPLEAGQWRVALKAEAVDGTIFEAGATVFATRASAK